MGSSEAKPRATHFQHPSAEPPKPPTPPTPPQPPPDAGDDHQQRISISNKMVERLVEDAQLAGGAEEMIRRSSAPKGDYKDNIYVEKLRCLDEKHSKRYGLTVEDVKATATRIDLRTSYVSSAEPVCEEYREKVIACYQATSEPTETIQCWDAIGAFSTCVHEATENRLRERTKRDEQQFARRSRHVAHAREHALKDLSPPTSAF